MREMKQVVQGDGGCPVPRNMQGQDGWDLEQPDLVKDVYIYIQYWKRCIFYYAKLIWDVLKMNAWTIKKEFNFVYFIVCDLSIYEHCIKYFISSNFLKPENFYQNFLEYCIYYRKCEVLERKSPLDL